ncbi:flagellar motor protein MotB [Bacillus sp. FJAT-47783]|uniref:flagellar motor protein MotB n=1 Tax=Bacillus sp. FJAT-47783 TaxID=2922712 RepID=UPI001FAC23A5|nr:flagellar motor protein MotB [Bacillus sp. FJAT-47783]
MAKRRRKKEEQHTDESWLIPYADLLTLLLALFVILFGMSSLDAQKFRQLASAFNATLTGGTGVLEYPYPPNEIEKTDVENADLLKMKEEEKEAERNKIKEEKNQLNEVEEKINTYIDEKNLSGKLQTTLTSEGLLITILDDILFDSGKADVRNQDIQLAKEISELLVMNPPHHVVISGHTDNVPIKNSHFDSNWHLSVMRAVNVMKILLENEQLDPKMFSAKGYGEFKPVASNDTAVGRQKNRRVEILVLPYGTNEKNRN